MEVKNVQISPELLVICPEENGTRYRFFVRNSLIFRNRFGHTLSFAEQTGLKSKYRRGYSVNQPAAHDK
jgi:hypothetical protein